MLPFRHVAAEAVYKASQVMDNPADLINVAIEQLIKESCELPAFSTLDRLVSRVRTLVNRRIFHTVLSRISAAEHVLLDHLLDSRNPRHETDFNRLKEVPKSATLSHLDEWLTRLSWVLSYGDMERLLEGISHAKIKHFAAEARALPVGDMEEFLVPKRTTLLMVVPFV